MRSLFEELLVHRAISVATLSASATAEKPELDAITVIQLDGDVINYVRPGVSLERHFAALRQARRSFALARASLLGAERGVFWLGTLGSQYLGHAWAIEAFRRGDDVWRTLSADASHWSSSLLGLCAPFALHAAKLGLRDWLRRRFENGAPGDVLSGRTRPGQ